jgi:hypothetical protein
MLPILFMMIAFLVFMGVSACASLGIISALVLGTRSQMPIECSESNSSVFTSSAESRGTLVTAYSH